MSFDYGSINLGLKNPFKTEGLITLIRGVFQSSIGLYLIITAATIVKDETVVGWILILFGLTVLGGGLRALTGGIFSRLRFFIGRNHPTSLAYNYSKSESSTAAEEKSAVAYTQTELEEMLVGRKNITFAEPIGFIARLIHTFIPKLLFLPYPIRNMSQRVISTWISTIVSLISYALVAFISLNGFAGESGKTVFPIYSIFLLIYLLSIWRKVGVPINRAAEIHVEPLDNSSLIQVITLSLILPITLGLGLSWLVSIGQLTNSDIVNFTSKLPGLNITLYLVAITVLALVSTVIISILLKQRLSIALPKTEVSELRENWQESVHPKEIFINLDNLVMANRRYKEVPNRVYINLDPELKEQTDGKGSFQGKLIQEIQPQVKDMNLGAIFFKVRFISLLTGNILFTIATILTLLFAYEIVDIYQSTVQASITTFESFIASNNMDTIFISIIAAIHLLIIRHMIKSFAQLLTSTAHLFFAEIQFESLLVYFKCEGTFTESKISTGTGIHDSTRSENTLVRSSITPWIITSRIISTTFAATGMKNMEHPRHILEMHKNEEQLLAIKNDVISFLKDRESIASITSKRDLGNASQIHQLNEQTRATPTVSALNLKNDEESTGYLEKENDLQQSASDKETANINPI